jgi:hypothetical protein
MFQNVIPHLNVGKMIYIVFEYRYETPTDRGTLSSLCITDCVAYGIVGALHFVSDRATPPTPITTTPSAGIARPAFLGRRPGPSTLQTPTTPTQPGRTTVTPTTPVTFTPSAPALGYSTEVDIAPVDPTPAGPSFESSSTSAVPMMDIPLGTQLPSLHC